MLDLKGRRVCAAEVWDDNPQEMDILFAYFTSSGSIQRMTHKSEAEVIGHPLTRGRLSYLRSKLGETDERFRIAEIPMIFEEHIELYDQNETQRMKHEKRPELEKLLISFAALLPTNETDE